MHSVGASRYVSTQPMYNQRCHFYARGTCKNGLSCLYSHKESTRRRTKDCSRLFDPRRAHDPSPSQESDSSVPSTSTSRSSPPSSVQHESVTIPGSYKTTKAGQIDQDATSSTRRPKRVKCWYFLYDHCKFGNECINLHELQYEPSTHSRKGLDVVSSDMSSAKACHYIAPAQAKPRPDLSSLLSGLDEACKRRCRHQYIKEQVNPPERVPRKVMSIDEALELDFENDKRMLAYLTRDLRQFVEGYELEKLDRK